VETKGASSTKEPAIVDDVHDALIRLGRYSLPCLINKMADTRWMPDPREEPLLGAPVVGDIAYTTLMDKGVPDFLPQLTHKKELRMDDYFLWPAKDNNRFRLRETVRKWVLTHPGCCAAPAIAGEVSPEARLRLSAAQLAALRSHLSMLRPGMSSTQVLRIVGNPSAIDKADIDAQPPFTGSHQLGLLGFCAGDHNEKLAYLYFTERWTDEIARRNPLRDRYVIIFFSAEGKLTRIFSNVPGIDPVFPATEHSWERLMWGEAINTK